MSETQKIIKYLAIAFAIFLSIQIIFGIITAIITGIGLFGSKLGLIDDSKEVYYASQSETFSEELYDIEKLKIKTSVSELEIKIGNELKVETSSNNGPIDIKNNSNTLKIIEDETIKLFNNNIKSKIIIYIPTDIYFKDVDIETGAGNITIEQLKTDDLDLDLGAGNVTIDNLIVEKKAKINGGVGKVEIKKSHINNLDLDVGVGGFDIQSEISEKGKIDCGIGKLSLKLLGNKEDYTIQANKGIGKFEIDNKQVQDNQIYGNGRTRINVEAGVGSVEISFE